MTKLVALFAASLVAALPAVAADLPIPSDPVVLPVAATWTSCYVGTDGGYKWGHSKFTTPGTYGLDNPGAVVGNAGVAPPAPFDVARVRVTTTDVSAGGGTQTGHTDGGLWGGQAGCNFQLSNVFVIGLEISGTFDWAKDTITQDVVSAATRQFATTVTTEIERRCQFRVGPRIGTTIAGLTGQASADLSPLVYATGGYAGTCYRVTQSGTNTSFRRAVANPDETTSGFWAVGSSARA